MARFSSKESVERSLCVLLICSSPRPAVGSTGNQLRRPLTDPACSTTRLPPAVLFCLQFLLPENPPEASRSIRNQLLPPKALQDDLEFLRSHRVRLATQLGPALREP